MHVKMLLGTLIVQIKTSRIKYVYSFENALVLGKKTQNHNAIMYSCWINDMHIIRFWSWKRIQLDFFILLLIIILIHWLWEWRCIRSTVNYLQLQAISCFPQCNCLNRGIFSTPSPQTKSFTALLSDAPKAKQQKNSNLASQRNSSKDLFQHLL